MTNVPSRIRDMWTDLYKLFDRNYRMENTESDWKRFWSEAKDITDKHGQTERLWAGIFLIGDLIEDRMRTEGKIEQIAMEGVR